MGISDQPWVRFLACSGAEMKRAKDSIAASSTALVYREA